MPTQLFSLSDLVDVGRALYGRNWQKPLARDLHLPAITVTAWCYGGPLPDLRKGLADLCRLNDKGGLALKIEALGPPE
jgi:hypothetical protein